MGGELTFEFLEDEAGVAVYVFADAQDWNAAVRYIQSLHVWAGKQGWLHLV